MAKLNMSVVNEWAEWARKNKPPTPEELERRALEQLRAEQLEELDIMAQLVAEECDSQVAKARAARSGQPVPRLVQPIQPELCPPDAIPLPRRALQPKHVPSTRGSFDWPAHRRMVELFEQREQEACDKRSAAAKLAAERRRKRQRSRQPAVLLQKLGKQPVLQPAPQPQFTGQNLGALLRNHGL